MRSLYVDDIPGNMIIINQEPNLKDIIMIKPYIDKDTNNKSIDIQRKIHKKKELFNGISLSRSQYSH